MLFVSFCLARFYGSLNCNQLPVLGPATCRVAWRCNGHRRRLNDSAVAGSTAGLARSANNLGQVVHSHTCLCHQTVQFGAGPAAGKVTVGPDRPVVDRPTGSRPKTQR